MIAPAEPSDAPTTADPRTPTSTPQSPGTTTPSHQCRNCRVSFCQPLSCGHVYCNECLGPRHSLSPGNAGCPECDHGIATPPKTLTPEPKVEHGFDDESREQCVRQIRRLSRMVTAMFILNIVLFVLIIPAGIVFAITVGRLDSTHLT